MEKYVDKLIKKYSEASLESLIQGTSVRSSKSYDFFLFQALTSLGLNLRALIFDDIHLYNALIDTLTFYSKYKPAVCYTVLNMVSGQIRYEIPSDRYVLKIEPDVEYSLQGDIYNSNLFLLYTRIVAPLDIRKYVIIQQWANTTRYLFNPEKYFTVVKEVIEEKGVRRLVNVLYLNTVYTGSKIGVYFTKSWEVEDLVDLPDEDVNWFIRYLSAKLKYILGEIYSSYGDQIPGETATFGLNGSAMKTEAHEAIEKLEMELITSSQKTLPFYG